MCEYTSTSMFAHSLTHVYTHIHTCTLSQTKKPHTHFLSRWSKKGSKVWWSVTGGATKTWEVDRWRTDDSKKDGQRRRGTKHDAVELVRCRHSPLSSPGNFSVTSCHHLVAPCPCHLVTYPLSNWACQPVVMRPGSPLTFCFFHTRYRGKRRGMGGRAVMSGHAYHPRSQATDINATGAYDLWGFVISSVSPPAPLL